jgi:hypothetical protein
MDKLERLIERYLLANTSRKKSATKGAITRLVNERADILGAATARSEIWTILDRKDVPGWMKQRFTPGSLYLEGDRVFGWWDDGSLQAQAEELPLSSSGISNYSVTLGRCSESASLWRLRGFEIAEELPFVRRSEELKVDFPISRLESLLLYGYAPPCNLQWHRGKFFDDDTTCLWVDRSIISAGFWCAYKWWPDCRWWYYERHPEWFVDSALWGKKENPVYYFAPESDSAVLGGAK